MYRNDDEFVRGQKLKLLLIAAIIAYFLVRHWLP